MNKTKLLSIACLSLLLINVGLLIFVFSGNRHKPNGDRNRNIIIKQLGFDNQQVMQYDSLILLHRKKMNIKNDSIDIERQKLYSLLNNKIEIATKDSIFMAVAKQQTSLEAVNFEHFSAIKKLCKPNQLSQYAALTKQLSKLFSKEHKPPNR